MFSVTHFPSNILWKTRYLDAHKGASGSMVASYGDQDGRDTCVKRLKPKRDKGNNHTGRGLVLKGEGDQDGWKGRVMESLLGHGI